MKALPRVVLVGGPDVDARLDLMVRLRSNFDVSALGSEPSLDAAFAARGFGYRTYRLNRGVNPIADTVSVGQLARILRELRPQIVHSFDTKPGVWGSLAARIAQVPIVVSTITGLGSLYTGDGFRTRATRSVYQTLQALACRAADLTIFQNHDDARQFVAAGVARPDKVTVILGSGVETSVYAPDRCTDQDRFRIRRELGLASDDVIVTMVSRIIRTKGVVEFMNAAERIRSRYPRARFLLIGPADEESIDRLSGDELARLRQIVTWPGPRRDLPAILGASDVFVLPSSYREGIPRVLLEAAAMGLPIVTTDSPGCNEVVDSGVNGFLIPSRDVGALVRAIATLVEQPALRRDFGRVSRERAVERFDLSVVAARTRSAYTRLLEQKALLAI